MLGPWPSAAVIPRRRSTAVHFQSVERRVQRNLEGLANVRLDELTVVRRHWLFFSLTRWVPHDGFIRHQNDHLSGRMTDISVMGEWQVAGVVGTRPLENVLGEAIERRFSFEAWNYLFSFQSYVRFEEFFVSCTFERFGAKCWTSGAFGFDDVLGRFLKTPLRHRAFFCELWLRPQVFLKNILSFFQSRAGFTCLTAMAIPSLSKALWWWYVEN